MKARHQFDSCERCIEVASERDTIQAAYEIVVKQRDAAKEALAAAEAQRDYLIDGIHGLQANYEHTCPMLCIACDLSGLAAQGKKEQRVPNRPVEWVIAQRDRFRDALANSDTWRRAGQYCVVCKKMFDMQGQHASDCPVAEAIEHKGNIN